MVIIEKVCFKISQFFHVFICGHLLLELDCLTVDRKELSKSPFITTQDPIPSRLGFDQV